jgi:hypothetical protein
MELRAGPGGVFALASSTFAGALIPDVQRNRYQFGITGGLSRLLSMGGGEDNILPRPLGLPAGDHGRRGTRGIEWLGQGVFRNSWKHPLNTR